LIIKAFIGCLCMSSHSLSKLICSPRCDIIILSGSSLGIDKPQDSHILVRHFGTDRFNELFEAHIGSWDRAASTFAPSATIQLKTGRAPFDPLASQVLGVNSVKYRLGHGCSSRTLGAIDLRQPNVHRLLSVVAGIYSLSLASPSLHDRELQELFMRARPVDAAAVGGKLRRRSEFLPLAI
jgi:hypothetical protein